MDEREKAFYESVVHNLRSHGWPRIDAESEALAKIERRRARSALTPERGEGTGPTPSAGGRGMSDWIEWAGGECPVSRLACGDFKRRDGLTFYLQRLAGMCWRHDTSGKDIIAYRVVRP